MDPMMHYTDTKNGNGEHTNSPMISNPELKIGDEFLKVLQDNSFYGMNGGDVTDHIAMVLEIAEWIKMPNVERMTYDYTYARNHLVETQRHGIFSLPIPLAQLDNPDELCRTEEFTVVRHSIGNDEEFVIVGPSKNNTVQRTPGSMSCIYHELFNRKDRGWEVSRTR
ncbi:hypothetical protein Tco_1162947 [Tanacetum coccineum]